jgi:hypothetical protein
MKAKLVTLIVSVAIGLVVVLSGCKPATPAATPVFPTPTVMPATATVTPMPTATPTRTPEAPGTPPPALEGMRAGHLDSSERPVAAALPGLSQLSGNWRVWRISKLLGWNTQRQSIVYS